LNLNKLGISILLLLVALIDSSAKGAISEIESLALIERVRDEFATDVATHGAELFIDLEYAATSIGAMATRSLNHKKWYIKVWGGVPKFPSATGDTFVLTLCHEMGHHLGGYPFYAHEPTEWAAAEGQADYWSTQACAKRLWRNDLTINETFSNVRDSGCELIYTLSADINLCKRIYRATEIQAELNGKISKGRPPSIQRRDTSIVKDLLVSHPNGQCRVDSMLMGLLCPRVFDFAIIPGRQNASGQNTISAENEARLGSCFAKDGFSTGARPRCWFKEATLDKAPPLPKNTSKTQHKEENEHISDDQLLPWIIN
jgi:hypothetical protein